MVLYILCLVLLNVSVVIHRVSVTLHIWYVVPNRLSVALCILYIICGGIVVLYIIVCDEVSAISELMNIVL